MSTSSWALELEGLCRRIASLEQALEDGHEVELDPWSPPEAMDDPPTPEQRRHFEELMVRLDACRTGLAHAAEDLASNVAEDHQRRVAARRYVHP